MHFWDGFYNRNVSFVIIMDMSGLRITTKASDLPWGRVPVFLIHRKRPVQINPYHAMLSKPVRRISQPGRAEIL